MKIAVFFDDLKKHVLGKCDPSEKFLVQKFFDTVLTTVVDVGVSRANLITKFRFSEKDIRSELQCRIRPQNFGFMNSFNFASDF